MAYDAIATYSPEYMHSLPKKDYVRIIQAAMSEIDRNDVPQTTERESYLRIYHIIGDRKKGIHPRIPVSRATWYAMVKDGRAPKPIHLSTGVSVWRESDINCICTKSQTQPSTKE
jgi:predicted DNA-binding transcriptional regulator AlpA